MVMEDKVARFVEVRERVKSMSDDEIWADFINNHHSNYFNEIQNLNCDMDIKVKLMQKFFQNQNCMIEAQQSFCPLVLVGEPIEQDGPDAGSDKGDGNQFREVTRYGRITKRPTFLQNTSSPEIGLKRSLSSTKTKPDLPESPKLKNRLTLELKSKSTIEPNPSAQKVIAEHATRTSQLFDSLLENSPVSSKTTEDNSIENVPGPSRVTNQRTVKTNKRFFKSRGVTDTQILKIVKSESDDDELSTSKIDDPIFVPDKPRLGRKRKLYTDQDSYYPCPVCEKKFLGNEINTHAFACTKKD